MKKMNSEQIKSALSKIHYDLLEADARAWYLSLGPKIGSKKYKECAQEISKRTLRSMNTIAKIAWSQGFIAQHIVPTT